jgi:membrane-bound metal-dependent hydrolase YbcI (DUF457 family)
MPSPLGHSLAGAIIYSLTTKGSHLLKSWKWLVVCVLFATLADADFVPALFGRLDLANRLHRHLTHTLLFATVTWAAAYGVLRLLRKPSAGRDSVVLFFCCLSHLFLDMLGKDPRPPLGIPLLWPFVRGRLKFPVKLLLDLHKDTYAGLFSFHNLGVLVYEAIVLGTVLLALIFLKLRYELRKRQVQEYGQVGGVLQEQPEEQL